MGENDQAPDGVEIEDARLEPFLQMSPETVRSVVKAIRAYDREVETAEEWDRLQAAADYLERWANAWDPEASA